MITLIIRNITYFYVKILMKTITIAAEAHVSDIFSSGNFREIENTFSYNFAKMYKYMFFRENFKEIH